MSRFSSSSSTIGSVAGGGFGTHGSLVWSGRRDRTTGIGHGRARSAEWGEASWGRSLVPQSPMTRTPGLEPGPAARTG